MLNEGLGILKASGKYKTIYNKWFGIIEGNSIKLSDIKKYLSYIMIPIFILLLIFIIWFWALKRQVKIKTKNLNKELQEREKAENKIKKS